MKKIIKCFILFLIGSFVFAFLSTETVNANYEGSKNRTSVTLGKIKVGDEQKLKLTIRVTYQRGFAVEGSALDGTPVASYLVCSKNGEKIITSPTHCSDSDIVINWTSFSENLNQSDYISKEVATVADRNLTTKTFDITTSLVLDSSGKENKYIVFVQSFFCAVRNVDDQFKTCSYWHHAIDGEQITSVEFKVDDILKTNVSVVENEEINGVLQTITDIVYTTVMPIIYIVLGLFLVVKGSILGVQIVKAADEPQVRQEKIGSLKWLVIGVAIAYAASGLIHFVTGYFKSAFGLE